MTLNEEYKEKLDAAPLFTVICDDMSILAVNPDNIKMEFLLSSERIFELFGGK